jgi:hypothetical protein
MVKVRWDSETGTVLDVEPASGPGTHTEDVDVGEFRQYLESECGSEIAVVNAAAKSIKGEAFADRQITASTHEIADEAVTVAFVEPYESDQRLEEIGCEECGCHPDGLSDWTETTRSATERQYRDWICPDCGEIVLTQPIQES